MGLEQQFLKDGVSVVTSKGPEGTLPAEHPIVRPAIDPSGAWIKDFPDGRTERLGSEAVRRFTDFLGPRPWPDERVDALGELLGGRWVDNPDSTLRHSHRKDASGILSFPSWSKVQLNLLRSPRVHHFDKSVAALFFRPSALVVYVATIAIGVAAFCLNIDLVLDSVASPLDIRVGISVILLCIITTALHEAAHAAALIHYGVSPRRMGVMLFYLVPAMFCDATEMWRLSPYKRVVVSMSGVLVQLLAASGAAGMMFILEGWSATLVAVLSLALYSSALINLFPLVKFDGYLALAGWLDSGHLAKRARRSLDALLFGGRRRVAIGLKDLALAAFALGGLIVPPAIVLLVVWSLLDLFIAWGTAGLLLLFSLVMYLLWHGLKTCVRLLELIYARGYGLVVAVTGFSTAGAAIALSVTIPVDATIYGSYSVSGQDHYSVYLIDGGGEFADLKGTHVEFRERGILLERAVGEGTVCSDGEMAMVSPLAFSPFDSEFGDEYKVSAHRYRVCGVEMYGEFAHNGQAAFAQEPTPMWEFVARRFASAVR